MSVSVIGAPPAPEDARRDEEVAWNWLQAQLGGRPVPAVLTIIGLGDLSILAVLATRAPATKVLALEPDAARASATLTSAGVDDWRRSGRLIYLAGPGYAGADQAWRVFPTRFEQPPLVVHPDSAGDPGLRGAMAVLAKIVFGVKANAEARRRFAPRYLLNSIRNLPAILSGGDVRELDGRAQGAPAVVVGAGPSLDASLDDLRRLQGRAVVIATDTALRPLLARGINPQFVVALDPSEINGRHLLDLPAHPDTWLVAESALDPRAVDAFRGRTLWFRVAPHQPWPWLNAHAIDVGRLDVWGSVLTAAYQVAALADCDPIVMVGADLSFPLGRPYVRGTTYEFNWAWAAALGTPVEETWRAQLAARKDIRIERDLTGVETPTSAVMLEFRDWLTAQARKSSRRHVNATGRGMLFGDGVEQGWLPDVLERMPVVPRISLALVPRPGGTNSVADALDSLSSRLAAEQLEMEPLSAWREFSGDGFEAGQLADALTAASRGLEALQETAPSSSSRATIDRSLSHRAMRWPEALWRLRCALAGDAMPTGWPLPAARDALLIDALNRLATIARELASAPDLAPSADATPVGHSPAGATVTWPEPIRKAVLELEALLGEAWGRSVPLPAGFAFAEGEILFADAIPGREAPASEARPHATHGCLLLVLEWLRCASSLENGSGLSAACDRVWALLGALRPGRWSRSPTGPCAVLVVEAGAAGQTAQVVLPLGVTEACLARALTGAMRAGGATAWELGAGQVDGASIRVAVRGSCDDDERQSDHATSILPRSLRFDSHRRLTVADQLDDGVLCVVSSGRETVLLRGDGSVVSYQEWPRPITGALSLGDSGEVAWSSKCLPSRKVTPYLMYRSGAAAAAVVTIDLAFRPGRGFWWRNRLYLTCLPRPDAVGGVASWAPGEQPRLLTTGPPLQGILPGADSLLLQPYVMGPGETVARTHPARVWSWSADNRGTPVPLGPFGASSGCAERAGWVATAYPQSDVVALEHRDGTRVQLRCYNPVRVAWADGSLVVVGGEDDMLIFEKLLETVER